MRRACLVAAAVAVAVTILLYRERSEPARSGATRPAAPRIPAVPDRGAEPATPSGLPPADSEGDGEQVKGSSEAGTGVDGDVPVRDGAAREVTILVLDARDRKPIPGVLVYENRDSFDWTVEFEGGNRIPGPATLGQEPRRADPAGRLSLGPARGSVELYFRADGYAWHAAEVSFDAGGEVPVELNPGGDARLLLPRFAELRAPQIWARRLFTDEWSRLAPPAEGDEILVRGLLADDYEFTVRRGMWFEDSKPYGSVTAAIRAGQTATITIPLAPDPLPLMVKVTGSVTVPRGWKKPPYAVTLEGAEEANSDVEETIELERSLIFDGPGLIPLRFESGAIPAGRYLVDIKPCLWAKEVVVTDRSSRFDFDLPEPVTVRVRIPDARDARVTWHVPVTVAGRSGWSSAGSVREGDAFVFQAPPGNVTIEAEAPGFLQAEKTIEIREDRDVTMSLDPAAVIVIRLRIDGKPFDGSGVHADVSSAEGGWWGGFDGGVARADHLEPGTWTVILGDVAGCEPAERVEVAVAAGETREVVFDLKRKVR